MYEGNLLIKDSKIYDTADGCSKKYICVNELWLLSVRLFTYIVIIYWCISSTCHGKSKIDDLNASGKLYLRKNVHDRY